MKSLIASLLVMAATLTHAAQPSVGTTQVMKSKDGIGTNIASHGVLTNRGKILNLHTNIGVGVGTLSGTQYGHLLTVSGGTFVGNTGDEIVIGPGSLNHQMTIGEIVSPTQFYTIEPLPQTYSSYAGGWHIYSNLMVNMALDVEQGGFIGADGSFGIRTGASGGNSATVIFGHPDGIHNYKMYLGAAGDWGIADLARNNGAPFIIEEASTSVDGPRYNTLWLRAHPDRALQNIWGSIRLGNAADDTAFTISNNIVTGTLSIRPDESAIGTALNITQAGNVGVGTITPTGKFDIAGTQNSYLFRINTNGMVWTNGNVGIGTNAPAALLNINGGTLANPSIKFDNAGGFYNVAASNFRTVFAGVARHTFWSDGQFDAQNLVITSGGTFGGNVGIGTTSPTNKLDVANPSITIRTNGASGYIFVSDANGTGTWQPLARAKIATTLSVQTTPVATAGDTETNLLSFSVPAHTLTNNGDRIEFRIGGRFSGSGGKQVNLYYGSDTVFTSANNLYLGNGWTITGNITRTGNTEQFSEVTFNINDTVGTMTTPGSQSFTLAQTNGIATTLLVRGVAATSSSDFVTNRTMIVTYWPAP